MKKVARRRYKKLMAAIGATIPQGREPPVADAATLKAERVAFTTGYTTNVRTQLLGANTKSSELQHPLPNV